MPVGSNGRKRVPLLQKTTVRQKVSAAAEECSRKKKAPTIHPHHFSKILFRNEDSHSKNVLGCDSSLSLSKYRLLVNSGSIPTYCTTKRISSSRNNARKKNEASTIHPHHCSKILFQNEDSHPKIIFGVSHHYHHQNTGCSIRHHPRISHPIVTALPTRLIYENDDESSSLGNDESPSKNIFRFQNFE